MASPATGYYEQPLLKEPQWTQLIPLYFFVGGAAGSLGVIGSFADLLSGDKKLAQQARSLALAGSVVSGALLVLDLGRPARFLNMLRVFKPRSTMSMGSWILSGFSVFAFAASLGDAIEHWGAPRLLVQLLRGTGRIGSVLFGMPFHNYTGVLLVTTALPVWNERASTLPGHFGMSGLQAGASILELIGHETNRALNLLGMLSASMETWEAIDLAGKRSQALLPVKTGLGGAMIHGGALLSGPLPLALRLASMLSGKSAQMRRLAACSGIVGSLLTRYGWVQAGKTSAHDWRLPLEIDAPEASTFLVRAIDSEETLLRGRENQGRCRDALPGWYRHCPDSQNFQRPGKNPLVQINLCSRSSRWPIQARTGKPSGKLSLVRNSSGRFNWFQRQRSSGTLSNSNATTDASPDQRPTSSACK